MSLYYICCSTGYPSDGIVQVEEEEEAETADETGTYTIEDEYRGQRQRKTKRRSTGSGSHSRHSQSHPVEVGHRGPPGAYWSAPDPPPRTRTSKSHNRPLPTCPAEGLNESDDSSMQSELQNLKSQLEDTRAQVVAIQTGTGKQ